LNFKNHYCNWHFFSIRNF